MPLYTYECAEHGRTDIHKPMAEASTLEFCQRCATPDAIMRRIYNPQRVIVRPSYYNVSPDDPQYSNFDRELELNEVRSPGDMPESRGATVTTPRTSIDHTSANLEAERNLRQAVEAAIVEV